MPCYFTAAADRRPKKDFPLLKVHIEACQIQYASQLRKNRVIPLFANELLISPTQCFVIIEALSFKGQFRSFNVGVRGKDCEQALTPPSVYSYLAISIKIIQSFYRKSYSWLLRFLFLQISHFTF